MTGVAPSTFDVAIVGGGPGGAATALSLRAHAPALSVVLIEASGYEAGRIGETLPPPARSLLAHLGVWDAFQAQGHRQVYGTAAAWGSAALLDNDFIYMPANTGWHLDCATSMPCSPTRPSAKAQPCSSTREFAIPRRLETSGD